MPPSQPPTPQLPPSLRVRPGTTVSVLRTLTPVWTVHYATEPPPRTHTTLPHATVTSVMSSVTDVCLRVLCYVCMSDAARWSVLTSPVASADRRWGLLPFMTPTTTTKNANNHAGTSTSSLLLTLFSLVAPYAHPLPPHSPPPADREVTSRSRSRRFRIKG